MPIRPLLLSGALLLGSALSAAAQDTVTQTIPLTAGWNSVWLEVDPADRDPTVVFAGAPVSQVWSYFPKNRTVEFIDDPEAGLFNAEGWNVFIPDSFAESFLTDLFAILPCRPYLVLATSDATLEVTGRAVRKPIAWRPNSFNLAGFPVDPVTGGGSPSLFFFNDPALRNSRKFRLTPGGTWVAMNNSDRIRRGEAYWVFTAEPTEFEGALEVEVAPGGNAIGFGTTGSEVRLIARNKGAFPGAIMLSNPNNLPLLRRVTLPGGEQEWQPWTSITTDKPLGAEASVLFEIGLDRSSVTGPIDSFIEVSGLSSTMQIPFTADVPLTALQAGGYAGLWVGNVTLSQVTDTTTVDDAVKDTPAEASFRLILHVDAAGVVNLLKSVIMMWKDGIPGTASTAEVPGGYVLVTDDTLIPSFKGATLRDGRPVGFRVSSVAYDFPENELPLTGAFGGDGQVLTGAIQIGKFSPTHPYRHKYHPDHDGLTPTFDAELIGENTVTAASISSLANNPARAAEIQAWVDGTAALPEDLVTAFAQQFAQATPASLRSLNPGWAGTDNFARPGETIAVPLSADQEELWDITRAIELTFAEVTEVAPGSIDTVGGAYRETITGMHQRPITVVGSFTLTRANAISTLNPAP